MRWSRDTDYHGSRTYALDPLPPERRSPKKFWTSLAVALRRAVMRRPRPCAAPETLVVVHGHERHFSILGVEMPATETSQLHRINWAFPLQEGFDGGVVGPPPHTERSTRL